MKFLRNIWLMIILKVTKKAEFHPLARKTIFRRTTEGQIDPPPSLNFRADYISRVFNLL